MYGGVWRNYRLFIPSAYTSGTNFPLVFNFHGYTSTALEQQLYSQFDDVADTGNFFVCYPNGLNNSWNIVGGPPDDPGFTDTLITIFHSAYNINLNRVYATGLSNGGFFSNLLACQMSDKIAAIAPVAGTNVNLIQNSCNPGRMVPVLYIHGTADAVVDYNGTAGYVSVADLMQLWSNHNGCDMMTDTVSVPNISLTDQCTAEIISWRNCDSSKQVIHYRVIGGGHSWPGAPVNINVTNQDFNASGVIWNFFNQFSLATAVTEIEREKIKCYPNPFTDEINIELPQVRSTVMLYSADGRMIQKEQNASGKIKWAANEIPHGIYYLRITNENSVYTIPVIRTK